MANTTVATKEDKNALDMMVIELRAAKDLQTAMDLGVSHDIIVPLYGAVYYLSKLEKPSNDALIGARKIAAELKKWATPRIS